MVISAADIYVAFYGLKNSRTFLKHLICKAFDLYGILSYREELPVFEGEEGLAIIGIFLPVGSESPLYACFSIRLTLFAEGHLCLQ